MDPIRFGSTQLDRELRLIAILPNGRSIDELVGLAGAAVDGGATAVQLRLKDEPASAVLAACSRLMESVTAPVYVNDRADIARLAGAHGVHVGADDLDPLSAREIMPAPLRVGVSVGTPDEAARAGAASVDYWSIGPFATTPSKQDAGRALGPDGFSALRALAPAGMPVIAIGGITALNAADAIGAGAHGVAVISALFDAADVAAAARALRTTLDGLLT